MTFGVSGYTIQDLPSQTDAITLSGSGNTITVTNATDTATISAVLSGAGFTKMGTGTLVLSGSNSGLSGTITIGSSGGSTAATPGGILQITNSNALGTAAITISGGVTGTALNSAFNNSALALSNGITLTNAITIEQKRTGTGLGPGGDHNPPIASLPASIINVSGNNTITTTGPSVTTAITLDSNGNQSNIDSNGGNLLIAGDIIQTASSTTERHLVLRGTSTGEISGSIGTTASPDPIKVWKQGSGTWTLSGSI